MRQQISAELKSQMQIEIAPEDLHVWHYVDYVYWSGGQRIQSKELAFTFPDSYGVAKFEMTYHLGSLCIVRRCCSCSDIYLAPVRCLEDIGEALTDRTAQCDACKDTAAEISRKRREPRYEW